MFFCFWKSIAAKLTFRHAVEMKLLMGTRREIGFRVWMKAGATNRESSVATNQTFSPELQSIVQFVLIRTNRIRRVKCECEMAAPSVSIRR